MFLKTLISLIQFILNHVPQAHLLIRSFHLVTFIFQVDDGGGKLKLYSLSRSLLLHIPCNFLDAYDSRKFKEETEAVRGATFSAYKANGGKLYLIYCYSSSFHEKMVLLMK